MADLTFNTDGFVAEFPEVVFPVRDFSEELAAMSMQGDTSCSEEHAGCQYMQECTHYVESLALPGKLNSVLTTCISIFCDYFTPCIQPVVIY